MKQLLTSEVMDQLKRIAPLSPTGRPLDIVTSLRDQSNPESIMLSFENCGEPDWWVGQEEGVYARQIRIKITLDQMAAAAVATGMERDEVEMILMPSRMLEAQEQNASREKQTQIEAHNAEVQAAWRAQYRSAAVDEKREMLFNRLVAERQLYGPHNKSDRRRLRESVAQKSLSDLEQI